MPTKKEKLQAIRKSIKHWVLDIKLPLMNGDKISFLDEDEVFVWSGSNEMVPCDGDSCDLCKILDSYDCKGCPLAKNGMSCKNINSPYNAFYTCPNLNTANNMICGLVHTYWAELEKKV